MKIILLIVIVIILSIILHRIWIIKRSKRITDNYVSSRYHNEYDDERERIELLYGDEHYACGDKD